jgi:hypothetical protein
MEWILCSQVKMKLIAVSFMLHRGTCITSADFECPATDAAGFEVDTTQIELIPELQACVHIFVV